MKSFIADFHYRIFPAMNPNIACEIQAYGSTLSILTISSCSERYSSCKTKWLHLLITDIKYSLIGQSPVSLNTHKTASSNQNSKKENYHQHQKRQTPETQN